MNFNFASFFWRLKFTQFKNSEPLKRRNWYFLSSPKLISRKINSGETGKSKVWVSIFIHFCTFESLKFIKLAKFKAPKMEKSCVLILDFFMCIHQNWFHVKSSFLLHMYVQFPHKKGTPILFSFFFSFVFVCAGALVRRSKLREAVC